jgi:protein TonB
MRADPFDTPEIQPAQARLILALVLSLALHLALAFLVQVKPATRPEARVKVLRVDLAGRAAADSRQTRETPSPAPPQKPEQAAQLEPAPAASPDMSLDQPSAPPLAPVQPMLAPKSPLPAVDIPLVEDPTYYTAKQVDVHPAASAPVAPVFPDAAAEDGVEGYVTLRLLIDDGGVVREISVVEAQPSDTFEAAALNAFRNARFSPALRNGRPVKSDVLIRVTFELLNRNGK